MKYQKERLDVFFEEVISIVDSCTIGKNFPKIRNFRLILYLSFALFLSYYGYENIDVIYESFNDTEFNLTNNRKNKLFSDSFVPATIKTIYEKENGSFIFSDSLNIVDNKNTDIMIWFNFFLHEMNHLINSKNNRVIDNKYIRCGISLYDVEKKKYINRELNEAFNTLQTENIEKLVNVFTQEKIVTPYFYQILKRIKRSQPSKCNYAPYPIKTSIIRPLYENEEFKNRYEENCINGSIEEIEYEFDKKTYRNAFCDLSDLMEQCNDNLPIIKQQETITKAKTLVKRYLVS